MAKMIRCPSGHVYDSEAHGTCPECARTGVAEPATAARTASAAEEGGSQGLGETKRGMPLAWLIGGGAAAAVVVAAAIFILRPSNTPTDPNADPDFKTCFGGDRGACNRAIALGHFGGPALANLYSKRGFILTGQRDYDGAFADFEEALKLAPDNAWALAGRGGVYFQKQDMERAIKDIEHSISIDPNIFISYVIRAGYFVFKQDLDHARADYQKALSLNIDPGSRKAVEGALKVLGPGAAAQASEAQSKPQAP